MKSFSLSELVNSFSLLEEFEWRKKVTLEKFLEQFSMKVKTVRDYGGEMSDQYLALRLLRASHLDKLTHCLDNITISKLTYSEVLALLCKMYKNHGNSQQNIIVNAVADVAQDTKSCEDKVSTSRPPEVRGWSMEGKKEPDSTMGKDPTDKPVKSILPLFNKDLPKSSSEIKKCKVATAKSVNSLRHGRNPTNQNNITSKCVICRSVYHWSMDCPDQDVHQVNIDPGGLKRLQKDISGSGYHAVVVSGDVTKAVCGLPWLLQYLESLSSDERQRVVDSSSSTVFNFLKVGKVTSLKKLKIPLTRDNNTRVSIEVEVVENDIPLLLSRAVLIKGRVKLDPHRDTMTMSGMLRYLNVSSSGLYYMLLLSSDRQS